jgi:hypothetical protein
MKLCSIDKCHKPSRARGWCMAHYTNWLRHGTPTPIPTKPSLIERVMAKVQKESEAPAACPDLGPCWIWTGHLNRTGYGQVNRGASEGRALVHRVTYEHGVGRIPEGLELDHLCSVRACCNPDHLEPVTHLENVRRGRGSEVAQRLAAQRTHCVNGHPYEGENYRITKSGRRRCRVCAREWAQRKRAVAA